MNVKIDDRQLKQFQRMCKSGPKEFQYVTAEYLNSSAFRARELNIKNIQSQMTIRDQRFLSSSLRVEKTKPVSINQQIAISGSINRPRFTGWKEQETGQTPQRKRVSTPMSRGGSMKGKIKEKYRLKSSKTPYKMSQYRNNFYFMLRVLGSRGGGQFLLTEKFRTKNKLLQPGLYEMTKFRKESKTKASLKARIIPLQVEAYQRPKKMKWSTEEWSDIKRRAEENSLKALERWKEIQRNKGLK